MWLMRCPDSRLLVGKRSEDEGGRRGRGKRPVTRARQRLGTGDRRESPGEGAQDAYAPGTAARSHRGHQPRGSAARPGAAQPRRRSPCLPAPAPAAARRQGLRRTPRLADLSRPCSRLVFPTASPPRSADIPMRSPSALILLGARRDALFPPSWVEHGGCFLALGLSAATSVAYEGERRCLPSRSTRALLRQREAETRGNWNSVKITVST